MSVFKSQFTKALSVIKSDDANIPFPQVTASGKSTDVVADSLVDSTKNFNDLNVKAGDIVYNTSDSTAATVIEVVDDTTILLNADIFGAADKDYHLYAASAQNTIGNRGCNIYVGGTGTLVVVTADENAVTFNGVPAGTVLPVQVLKVKAASTATGIIALW